MSVGASPKDFGAVGDGIADDTAAVQACLNASRAVDFGGPENTYLTTGTLHVQRTVPQVLTGGGATIHAGAAVTMMRFANAGHSVAGVVFDGDDRTGGVGLSIESGASGSRVQRCSFVNVAGSGVVVAAGAHRVRLVRCLFDHCGHGAALTDEHHRASIGLVDADHCVVRDNEILRANWGIVVNGTAAINYFACQGNMVTGASPAPAGSRGISVVNGRAGRIQKNTVVGFADSGIDCRGCHNLSITGNSTTGGGDGVYVGDAASNSVALAGNVLRSPKRGIRVFSDQAAINGVLITGNTVSSPTEVGILVQESGAAQVQGVTIVDNDLSIASTGAFGVQIVNAECSRVSGNRIHRPRAHGIRLDGVDIVDVGNNLIQDASHAEAGTATPPQSDAISVAGSNRVLIRDNTAYGGARHAVAIDGGAAMTITGTRWRSVMFGVDNLAIRSQQFDNVNTNVDPLAVRIMPLGDSITDGYPGLPGGYRVGLWQKLRDGGYTVDFVGSLANGPAEPFDRDHEGHSGYRISEIDERVGLCFPSARPDVVLLHIGTNDVTSNFAGIGDRLSQLVDHIVAAAPTAHVFVATITPAANAARESSTRQYNALIPGIVSARASAGEKVYLVDMHPALNPATDLYDGLHPNAQGYAKMATVWYDALRSRAGVLTP
ncbi:right-handed parallel beta-helix repeat-containing protein [Actinomycetes bacterium KLBMP 9797]